ncbi:DUF3857 domain-containing protein [Kiritimatiellota bacterium B12222]|nr:DUF3857 domain-containing protein [Kiritimatiellota bacterium B12222]
MYTFSFSILFFVVITMGGTLLPLQAGEAVLREPAPAWVEWLEPNMAEIKEEEKATADGSLRLLYDRQIQVEEDTEFSHRVTRLLNPSGVEDLSRLMFEWEPSYQTLTIHRLRIHREGEVLDYLDSQEIQIRERESDLESNLYQGLLSAEILFKDIRPGDVVEWAFSIKGSNPIFQGTYSDSFGIAAYSRIRHYRLKILLPENADEQLVIKTSDDFPQEILRRSGNEVIAELYDLEPMEDYPDSTSWFYPYPWISINEYKNWAEVVAWALPLYSEVDHLPAEVEPVREKLMEMDDPDERIVQALIFVQETLRYISQSSGLHSHKPYPMADVLERRYGDCKDNAQLLVALLRSMDIEAWPALVDTGLMHTIDYYHPSPHLFDHVVVLVKLPSGEELWLDPTDSYQRGPLSEIFMTRYGKALVIREGETALTEMPGGGHDSTLLRLEERYSLPDEKKGVTTLDVKTVYKGYQADSMRYYLAGNSQKSLQDYYADIYDEQFGSAEALEPLRVEDDESGNIITVYEKWALANPWKPGETEDDYPYMEFVPLCSSQMRDYPNSLRQSRPYPLSFPKKVEHRIRITLPVNLPFESESFERDTPYIYFSFKDGLQSKRLIQIEYTFETKTDHVPAEALATYKEVMEEVADFTSYTLYDPWMFVRNNGEAESLEMDVDVQESRAFENVMSHPHYGLLGWGLLSICVGAALGIWSGRSSGPPPLLPEHLKVGADKLTGIGGWLILPILGLFFNFFANLYELIFNSASYFDADTWSLLTEPGGEAYHALWGPGILLGTCYAGGLVGFIPVLLVNFFKRKMKVPRCFIGYLLIGLAFLLLDLVLTWGLGDALSEEVAMESSVGVVRFFIYTLVWVSYFKKSQRVKLTFTRP